VIFFKHLKEDNLFTNILVFIIKFIMLWWNWYSTIPIVTLRIDVWGTW